MYPAERPTYQRLDLQGRITAGVLQLAVEIHEEFAHLAIHELVFRRVMTARPVTEVTTRRGAGPLVVDGRN